MQENDVVWIDHKQAKIFHLGSEVVDESVVLAPLHNIHHKHPRGPGEAREHPEDAKRFFHDVAELLGGTGEVLVVGPGTAKLELLKYAHKHDHKLEPRIVGIETVDHPTDPQIVAYAKKYFSLTDALRSAR